FLAAVFFFFLHLDFSFFGGGATVVVVVVVVVPGVRVGSGVVVGVSILLLGTNSVVVVSCTSVSGVRVVVAAAGVVVLVLVVVVAGGTSAALSVQPTEDLLVVGLGLVQVAVRSRYRQLTRARLHHLDRTVGRLFFRCCVPGLRIVLERSALDWRVQVVLPGLYVGNYRDSKDATQLERFEITHILAIHDAARRLHSDKHYLCIMAADTPDQNLSQYFSICNDFIHSARLRGGNVLIHCLAGMSRSVTVAVAYIMSTTNLSWKDALKVVRVGRAVANPNVGFQQQLEDFESTRLQEERRRLRERYPSLALSAQDAEICRQTLISYEGMALAREVCEGKCAMGRTCPTGLCRQSSKRSTSFPAFPGIYVKASTDR
ncbi:hypothetical protein TSAR_012757, partial [Trichomalopsis sarcophagae]